jgi:hypothetical protein
MLGWLVLKVVLVKEFPLPETNMVHPNSKLCIWGLGACSLEFIHNIAWVSDVSKLQMNQTDQENMHRIVICREFPAQMKSTIRKLTYIFFAPHHDESAKRKNNSRQEILFPRPILVNRVFRESRSNTRMFDGFFLFWHEKLEENQPAPYSGSFTNYLLQTRLVFARDVPLSFHVQCKCVQI